MIEGYGFQIVTTTSSTSEGRDARPQLRGGNWGRGPWPISGGPPVAAIVAYDPAPIAPTRKQKKRFPFIANARLLCKEQLRDAFNDGFAKDQHCNVVHSSDNGREAMDYLRIIMPAQPIPRPLARSPADNTRSLAGETASSGASPPHNRPPVFSGRRKTVFLHANLLHPQIFTADCSGLQQIA